MEQLVPNIIKTVHLMVSDLKKSAQFYQMLGFEAITKGDKILLNSKSGSNLISLEKSELKPDGAKRAGLYHFAILLPNREELASFAAYVLEKKDQFKIDGFSDHLVSEAIYIRDPDDIGIEIYCDRDQSLWQWDDMKVKMSVQPLDIAKLITQSKKIWTGFEKNTRIGHVHLHVSDLPRAKKFYSQILGLSHTASMPGALFFAAGEYHHHIGVNTWLGDNMMEFSAKYPGLHCFELYLSNKENLDKVISRLESFGVIPDKTGDFYQISDFDGILINLGFSGL